MRNLKKVMALALATVMLLGIMVMGAGAADYKSYKDAAAVDAKYELAVELLNELGIFKGDTAGNLNAKNTLTRAEAAKVIATLKLTEATASKIAAPITAPFADVATSDWFAPYVAYCKDIGIISGIGDNKFDPAGTLTGFAFAKMLLVTIGNKADIEGYTGASWDTNVNLGALKAKLLDNLDGINLADAITREQAIQMAYNALQANAVYYYGGGTSITLPDGTTVNTSNAARDEYGYSFLYSLYKNTYETGTSTDEFGLPLTTWTKGNDDVIVAAAPSYTVLATYADASTVTAKTIYADAKLTKNQTYSFPVWFNAYENDLATQGTDAEITKTGTGKPMANYAGATMKLIKLSTDNYILFVEYNTLVEAGAPVAATATAKAYVNVVVGTETLKIETEAYKEGELLSITLGKDAEGNTKVLTHKAATIVTGKVSETVKSTNAVVINGTKYVIAKTLNGKFVDAATATAGDYTLNSTNPYNLVIENGYVVGTATPITAPVAASLEKVYYLNGYTAVTTNLYGAAVAYAQVISMADASVSLVPVETVKVGDAYQIKTKMAEGELYTIKDLSGKSYKELVDFDGKTDIGETTLAETDKALKKADKSITTAAGKAYVTAGTMILNVTGSGETLKAAYVTAPFDVALTDGTDNTVDQTASKVIYTVTKDKDGVEVNKEAAVIIIKGTINANATGADYYVFAGNNGTIYNAAEKATVFKRTAIDLKTFEKVELLDKGNATVSGFVKATLAKEAYTLVNKTDAKFKTGVTATINDLYGTFLTAAGCEDYETANAKFLNPNSVKNAEGKVISNLAELLKSGKTFAMEVNATAKTVAYIIVVG